MLLNGRELSTEAETLLFLADRAEPIIELLLQIEGRSLYLIEGLYLVLHIALQMGIVISRR